MERAFREVRRRTNIVGRFATEAAALAVVFRILEEERLKWREVKVKAEDIAWIDEAGEVFGLRAHNGGLSSGRSRVRRSTGYDSEGGI